MKLWNMRKSYKRRELSSFKDQSLAKVAHFDRARVINSSAFRRLQGKTQVLNIGENDFYRNRLTHSLEVAQIASGILLELIEQANDGQQSILPTSNLVETIGLAHDIGHPAFGHDGERTLNICMKDHGGFEGNGQTLRILTKLGEYSFKDGFDLSRRTLLGVIKYPTFYSDALNSNIQTDHPPKCLLDTERDIFEWIVEPLSDDDRKRFCTLNKDNLEKHYKTRFKSLDCSIMELADDITYGVHDFEDMLALKLVTLKDWEEQVILPLQKLKVDCPLIKPDAPYGLQFYQEKFFSSIERERKWAVSMLIGYFIQNTILVSDDDFESPLLKYNADLRDHAKIALEHVTKLVFNNVVETSNLRTLEFKSRKLIRELFDVFCDNPLFMGEYYLDLYEKEPDNKYRIVCDYIAGMTDSYASKKYKRLFMPDIGSIYDH